VCVCVYVCVCVCLGVGERWGGWDLPCFFLWLQEQGKERKQNAESECTFQSKASPISRHSLNKIEVSGGNWAEAMLFGTLPPQPAANCRVSLGLLWTPRLLCPLRALKVCQAPCPCQGCWDKEAIIQMQPLVKHLNDRQGRVL
jgi:hypothetical protein